MYEISETESRVTRIVLVTDEIGEVVRHFETEGFQFIFDVLGVKIFDHTDGRTASVCVRA